MCREKTKVLSLIMIVVVLLAACTSKAAKALEKVELGQRYLTELNYTEAVASFTEAIGLDPENIPAYMGRAQAYAALEQYDDAKTDYTTVIEKTAEQPYMQAEAYVGRAEINELTTDNEDALSDYEAASAALDTVDVEKITDVTEQMLEALKIKVYNACARLNAFLGRQEAAVAGYTKALDSLAKLPDDAEVLDVKGTKITSYTGRSTANEKLENYEAVLPDYDALIALGEDKTEARDTLLAAISLNQSKEGGLNGSNSWLNEVNHVDYAEEIQLTVMEALLEDVAAQAEQNGAEAYDKIKELLSTENAKASMRALLARGYQLRCYEGDKMLAVYADATSWEDVNVENSPVTADALTQVVYPTEDEIAAVSLEKLYVYYGGYEGRSREGEGIWFILNPDKTDLTAETYQWENDNPKGDFKKKEAPKLTTYNASQTLDSMGFPGESSRATITYGIGSTTVRIQEVWYDNGVQYIVWDTTFILSQPLTAISKGDYSATFYAPVGTVIKCADGYEIEYWAKSADGYEGEFGKTLTLESGKIYSLNYAGIESYGVKFAAK